MRNLSAAALFIALCAVSGTADARSMSRAEPDSERVQHAKRMVNAMDDYDAQIVRRQKQLRKEMRDMERMSKRR